MFILKAILGLAQNPLIRNTGLEILNTVSPQVVTPQVYQTTDYQALKHKKVAFKIVDQGLYFGCAFENSIQFFDQEESVELLINIDSDSLRKLITKEANAEDLVKENLIQMDGDSQLLIHLFNLSALVDTSFEHILQKLFGTGPAVILNHVGNAVGSLLDSTNQFVQGCKDNPSYTNNPLEDLFKKLSSPFKSLTSADPFVDHSKK